MHYNWLLSLKETAKCSGKWIDVHQPKKLLKDCRNHIVLEGENSVRKLYHFPSENIFQKNFIQQRFYELNKGDPSRNIIEMIFRTASIKPLKHMKKITRVLRVKNSIETLVRFEEYREMVKKRAHNQYMKHPRSMVDGNELLQFYMTTVSCCSQKLIKVWELCLNPKCGVCRIIQFGFDTEDTKKNGIQLSARSETLSDDKVAITAKGKNVKRAVVICRVIAGVVVNTVGEGHEQGFDSIGIEGSHIEVDQLFVKNPDAVLPCFVIVCA